MESIKILEMKTMSHKLPFITGQTKGERYRIENHKLGTEDRDQKKIKLKNMHKGRH